MCQEQCMGEGKGENKENRKADSAVPMTSSLTSSSQWKKVQSRDAWVAQLVKRPTSAQVDFMVHGFKACV